MRATRLSGPRSGTRLERSAAASGNIPSRSIVASTSRALSFSVNLRPSTAWDTIASLFCRRASLRERTFSSLSENDIAPAPFRCQRRSGVLDHLDLPRRHVVDPAVDAQLLLLGGPLDEGKLAEVLELKPDVLLHDQPHPLVLRHVNVERPDLLVDPLARLEGVHQPDRNVLVLALVVVEDLDPPAFVVTADDDVRDLQVADGELQNGG